MYLDCVIGDEGERQLAPQSRGKQIRLSSLLECWLRIAFNEWHVSTDD